MYTAQEKQGSQTALPGAADFDQTGILLWPASQLLARYLHANHSALLLEGAHACELGAGLGLVRLLAAQHCPVVATDHSTEVLRLLERNVSMNPSLHTVRYDPPCSPG